MTMYNGYKNWNHWNVSLWLNNDEALYRRMMTLVGVSRTLDTAATILATQLRGQKTPDGAPYSFSAIRVAMRGTRS